MGIFIINDTKRMNLVNFVQKCKKQYISLQKDLDLGLDSGLG